MDAYDAGLLSGYGGGDVEWWQDYIRAELGRAHEFYAGLAESALFEAARRAEVAEGKIASMATKAAMRAQHIERLERDLTAANARIAELERTLERIAELTPGRANAATAHDLHLTINAIAVSALRDAHCADDIRAARAACEGRE